MTEVHLIALKPAEYAALRDFDPLAVYVMDESTEAAS